MNNISNKGKNQSKQLFDESPLTFSRTIADCIGLELAIILQQLHYLSQQPNSGKKLADGHKYIYNSYPQWKSDFFPFWSERTIQRLFRQLEGLKVVISCQNGNNRSKYYRINYAELDKLITDTMPFHRAEQSISPRQSDVMKDSFTTSDCRIPSRQLGTMENDSITSSGHVPSRQLGTMYIQRSHTKKSEETKKSTNTFLASDDAGNEKENKIHEPESLVKASSGAVVGADKTLHQQLMSLIESATGKLTSSEASKEGKGAKLIREYIEKNPDTTVQDVVDCLRWIRENKRWMRLSLTSVASELRTYMTNKRLSKDGKVRGTQFLTAQEKSLETMQNRDYEKLSQGAQEYYEQLNASIPKRKRW